MDEFKHILENRFLILIFPEKLTLDVLEDLNKEKDKLLASSDYDNVVCDVSGVKLLDSSGISLFLTMRNALKREGKDMLLYKPGPQVLNLLSIVRLRDVFKILPDEADLEALVFSGEEDGED